MSTKAGAKKMKALILRTVKADLTSRNGFQWPDSGYVECTDWDPTPECRGGLHGLLWGEGNGSLLNWDGNAKWLVVEVDEEDVVPLGGKVKFPKGTVIYCGDRYGAIQLIAANGKGTAIVGYEAVAGDYGTATAGDNGKATAGSFGTATAGDNGKATVGKWGTATAGHKGTATAGDRGTATAGYEGTATAGYEGTATAGYKGTATAGYGGTATAGYKGTATAGYAGTATVGYEGTATAGDYGTATAGGEGTATAGEGGVIQIWYWDGNRYRVKMGYIGENGLEAGVPYMVNDEGEFVREG